SMNGQAPLFDSEPLIEESARRKRRRRWLLVGLALGTVSVLGLLYGVGCWRGQRLLTQEIEKIASRGEPVWYADLAPRPTDPALARGRLIAATVHTLDRVPYEPFDEAIAAPASPVIQAKVQPLLDAHRPSIDRIIAQLRQGDCRLEYDFQTPIPFSTLLPIVQDTRMAARILTAEFRIAAARGQRAQAIQAMTETLELDDVLRHEPFAVSQYVRAAVARYALDDLQIALGDDAFGVEALLGIAPRLAVLESRFRVGPALRSERAAMLTTMENLGRLDMSNVLEDPARGVSRTRALLLTHWWGSWIYRPRRLHQQAIMLRTMSRMADLIDLPGPEAAEQFAEADAVMRDGELPLCEEFSSHLHQLRDAALNHRQRFVSARLALAVCRFRELHERLPDSLSELTDSPPMDATGLLSGQPVGYVKTGDGFVIYDGSPEQGRFEVRFAR
ncbi:MAG TPA: hypothetical protein VF306_15295, partial [Pirellulales bacterium]